MSRIDGGAEIALWTAKKTTVVIGRYRICVNVALEKNRISFLFNRIVASREDLHPDMSVRFYI